MIFWLLLIKTGTIPSKGCANPLEWAQVSQEALPELGWCILLWFSPKLLLCPWQSGRRSLWVWTEQQPRRGIPPVDFLLSAPVLLGRPWQQTSKHLKISLSRKNNLPSTTEPPRRIRRAEGWIGDFLFFFLAYYKYGWCTMMRSVAMHTKENVKDVSNFKGYAGASFGISPPKSFGMSHETCVTP